MFSQCGPNAGCGQFANNTGCFLGKKKKKEEYFFECVMEFLTASKIVHNPAVRKLP